VEEERARERFRERCLLREKSSKRRPAGLEGTREDWALLGRRGSERVVVEDCELVERRPGESESEVVDVVEP
jgi:hypothetical protein